jgi:hypothetical protein
MRMPSWSDVLKIVAAPRLLSASFITLLAVHFLHLDVAKTNGQADALLWFFGALILINSIASIWGNVTGLAQWVWRQISSFFARRATDRTEREQQDTESRSRRQDLDERVASLSPGQRDTLLQILVRGQRRFQAWEFDPILNELLQLNFLEEEPLSGSDLSLWSVPNDLWQNITITISDDERGRRLSSPAPWQLRFARATRGF